MTCIHTHRLWMQQCNSRRDVYKASLWLLCYPSDNKEPHYNVTEWNTMWQTAKYSLLREFHETRVNVVKQNKLHVELERCRKSSLLATCLSEWTIMTFLTLVYYSKYLKYCQTYSLLHTWTDLESASKSEHTYLQEWYYSSRVSCDWCLEYPARSGSP